MGVKNKTNSADHQLFVWRGAILLPPGIRALPQRSAIQAVQLHHLIVVTSVFGIGAAVKFEVLVIFKDVALGQDLRLPSMISSCMTWSSSRFGFFCALSKCSVEWG